MLTNLFTTSGIHLFLLRASRRESEMQIQKLEWKLASKMPTIEICCLSFILLFLHLFPYCLWSTSELTGGWGTTFHQRPMLYTTRWNPLTKGPFSPAWRAPAVWLHFHRATAPLPLLKRASSKYIQHFSFSLFPLNLKSYMVRTNSVILLVMSHLSIFSSHFITFISVDVFLFLSSLFFYCMQK